MDILRILSRSTNKSTGNALLNRPTVLPSQGQNDVPQLFPLQAEDRPKKRKREQEMIKEPDFFENEALSGRESRSKSSFDVAKEELRKKARVGSDRLSRPENQDEALTKIPFDERKRILQQHKLKVLWLNPPSARGDSGRRKEKSKKRKAGPVQIYPSPLQSFKSLRTLKISERLASNIDEQGYIIPTEVQIAGLPLLLGDPQEYLPDVNDSVATVDLLSVAPTGSGKTLAYLIPLLEKLQQHKRSDVRSERRTLAVILAPTKELVAQIVNEGKKLSRNMGIHITQTRKGMKLPKPDVIDNEDIEDAEQVTVVKADILVSTPGMLDSMVQHNLKLGGTPPLADVRHLILDEADVLLDPLFRPQTLSIWNSLSCNSLRVGLWSATMGSSIEEVARETIDNRRKRLRQEGSQKDEYRAVPLVRLVVGLKDSAIPNVQHKLVYAATEQGKLMGLRQLLHPTSTSSEVSVTLVPPFLVFTQTIERAVALHSELLYDIPAEAGGISRIAVLHSDLSDTARDAVMTRFRKGEIWVLITTDLLSRGIDFRGVNGVVNYDIPTSSAAYIHRVGRTGRAGRQGGVAVTLYSQEDIPYMRNIANVVAAAQQQNHDVSRKEDGIPKWLLEALPSLTKKDKQKLKKHGVESRTARKQNSSHKTSKRSQISTKAGFQRRVENNKAGAILGSQRRKSELAGDEAAAESDFGGFD